MIMSKLHRQAPFGEVCRQNSVERCVAEEVEVLLEFARLERLGVERAAAPFAGPHDPLVVFWVGGVGEDPQELLVAPGAAPVGASGMTLANSDPL